MAPGATKILSVDIRRGFSVISRIFTLHLHMVN
jgi:hypothetical protein